MLLIRINSLLVAAEIVAVEREDTVVHTEDTVSLSCNIKVVSNHHKCLATCLTDIEEEAKYFVCVCTVKVTCRLVCEEHLGVVDKSTSDRYSLTLTTGKLGGEVVETLGEAEALNKLTERLLIRSIRLVTHYCGKKNVLKSCELGDKVVLLVNKAHLLASEAAESISAHLCNILVIDEDTACVCTVETCADVEECRLTGTGGTDDSYELTLLDLNIYTVYRGNNGIRLSILLNYALSLKHILSFSHYLILS